MPGTVMSRAGCTRLDICTDVWITLAQAQYDLLPAVRELEWQSAAVGARQNHVCARDIAAVVSPACLPSSLPRIWLVRSLPFSIMPPTPAILHPPLLEIDELRAVQVSSTWRDHP